MSELAIKVFCRVKPSPHLTAEEQQQRTKPQPAQQPQQQQQQNGNRQTTNNKPPAQQQQTPRQQPQQQAAKTTAQKTPRAAANKTNKQVEDAVNTTKTANKAVKKARKLDEDDFGGLADEAVSPRRRPKPKTVQKQVDKSIDDTVDATIKSPRAKQEAKKVAQKQIQKNLNESEPPPPAAVKQQQTPRKPAAKPQQQNGVNPPIVSPRTDPRNQRVNLSGFEERRTIQGQPRRTINQPGSRPVYDKYDTEYDVEYGTAAGRDSIYIHAPDGFIIPNMNNNLNAKNEYQFTFSGIFDQGATQVELYDAAARPIVDSALTGYNGTIFAYGQTSTGKTYTIFGPEESMYGKKGQYNSRNQSDIDDEVDIEDGLVARTLAHIFDSGTPNMRVEVSYLEIYKEIGYDLFAGVRGQRKRIHHFSELPRVTALTSARGNLYLRNLSVFEVETRREAMELLMLGNANRQVAETHLNKASSRSHSVFTVYLTIEVPELRKTLRSKVNLVDLAGSERVGKSHMQNGSLLSEAKNINLSLHHLQQVIVSLSAKEKHDIMGRKRHIPYRNSMLTMVLSDSLGGNSLTAMVATMSPELDHLDESISTCRFAQRVSRIKNKPKVNETVENEIVIAQLRQELDKLKNEYGSMGNLQPDEEEYLLSLMQAYLKDQDKDVLEVGMDQGKVQFCFQKMRDIINARQEAEAANKNKKSSTCVIL